MQLIHTIFYKNTFLVLITYHLLYKSDRVIDL